MTTSSRGVTSRSRGRGRRKVSTIVGDSSNVSQPDVPPPPSIIQMRIWSDGMFAPNNRACTQEISNVIKSMYNNSWPNYTKISTETRKR
ncbi:uncharacterized protein DS421_14g473790 [Arachis hypogaea]|nr:uncharacterized protein DS421_14g473790 [Arachis hypogaea]